jgi:hypothetical protein
VPQKHDPPVCVPAIKLPVFKQAAAHCCAVNVPATAVNVFEKHTGVTISLKVALNGQKSEHEITFLATLNTIELI